MEIQRVFRLLIVLVALLGFCHGSLAQNNSGSSRGNNHANGSNSSAGSSNTNRSNNLSRNITNPNPRTDPNLEQYERQLNALLKTRRNEEKDYISKIVDLVEQGKLPAKLVVSSFQYARDHRPGVKYPFIYFAAVLAFQAERLRIEIPRFDFRIYQIRPDRNR